MAFWPDVKKNEKFSPKQLLENDLRRMVNRLNGFSAPPIASNSGGMVRLPCYNAGTDILNTGSPVSIHESGAMSGSSVPVKKADTASKPWGVLESTLEPDEMGNMIVAGYAVISAVSGAESDYVEPTPDGKFQYTATGTARVLFGSDETCIVLLGSAVDSAYRGPFALSLGEGGEIRATPGYLNRNGLFSRVEGLTCAAGNGEVCLSSSLELSTGKWSDPVLRVTQSPGATDYPVGSCAILTGGNVQLIQYPCSVAFILLTGECPYAD